MQQRRSRNLLAISLVSLVALAACGDDDNTMVDETWGLIEGSYILQGTYDEEGRFNGTSIFDDPNTEASPDYTLEHAENADGSFSQSVDGVFEGWLSQYTYALNADGTVNSYDIETQVRSVFQNVKWILEDSGSSWEKIVDVTVFLTNMKDDFPTYNRFWKEYFEQDPPCRTTLEINCLPTPIAIELKVIATV